MSLIVNCPTCGATVEWAEKNAARPFCSERCKLIDLGAWASESYRVATDEDVSAAETSSASISTRSSD
ncbi:MAG: DNA gyrase inhibitor YacG [Gammaproteobacteria bacterium]|nr:DNA gyrase inhibitor YacG [Gammaproteobacteria bacterium]